MPHFNNDFIEHVRETADIITVVSRYLNIKKTGANYKGPCPFHQEKSPSFIVSPHKQIYKCFGCGKAGNVFHFIMEVESVSFPESVEALAKEYNIPLPEPERQQEYERSTGIMDALSWAKTFFQRKLASSEGKEARNYLIQRGINKQSIDKFELGFAPDSWNSFFEEAIKEGFDENVLMDAGLINKKENKVYDRFRNRLIFPIWNISGKVIAFGGRVLRKEDEPKYLNSPETNLFQKKKILYSLHLARECMMKEKVACIMEGYTDVLMAHQCGYHGAVATLGTALTSEHASIVKRYCDAVVLLFDGDSAGIKAASRSLPQFLSKGIEVKIAIPPNGIDPFDFITEHGNEGLQQLLKNAQDFFDFEMNTLRKDHDVSSVLGKRAVIQKMAQTIMNIPDEITKRLFAERLAKSFQIPKDFVFQELGFKKRNIAPLPSLQVASYKNKLVNDQEEFVIAAIMHQPEWRSKIFEHYDPSDFQNPIIAKIAYYLKDCIQQKASFEIGTISSRMEPELGQALVSIYYGENIGDTEKTANRLHLVIKGLKRQKQKEKLAKLKKKLLETSTEDQKKQILIDAQEVYKNRLRDGNN